MHRNVLVEVLPGTRPVGDGVESVPQFVPMPDADDLARSVRIGRDDDGLRLAASTSAVCGIVSLEVDRFNGRLGAGIEYLCGRLLLCLYSACVCGLRLR